MKSKNIKNRTIEDYILLGYKPKKNRSVEKNILLEGHKWILFAVLILALYNFLMIFDNFLNVGILTFIFIFLLLVFGTIISTIKLCNFGLNYYIKNKSEKQNSNITIYVTLGVVTSIFFTRVFFPLLTDDIANLIGSTAILFIGLIVMFCGVGSYYKVYLIRKFCPDLKDRKS